MHPVVELLAGSRDFGIGKESVVENFLEFGGKPIDLKNSRGFERTGINFWEPMVLGIVEVPARFALATAPDVAVVDRLSVVFAIEKEGSAAVVAKVGVGEQTLHLTDQSGAEVAAWAVIVAPIRSAHLVENLRPCRHGSIPAGVPADH